jgi:hypothetical protein
VNEILPLGTIIRLKSQLNPLSWSWLEEEEELLLNTG